MTENPEPQNWNLTAFEARDILEGLLAANADKHNTMHGVLDPLHVEALQLAIKTLQDIEGENQEATNP